MVGEDGERLLMREWYGTAFRRKRTETRGDKERLIEEEEDGGRSVREFLEESRGGDRSWLT